MDPRKVLTSLGSGVTTFFIVTVLVIELLDFEFSAIIAIPVGVFAGIAVLFGVTLVIGDVSEPVQLIVTGYAAFGLILLFLLGARYVNIGRSIITTSRILGSSVAVAILTTIIARYTQSLPTSKL